MRNSHLYIFLVSFQLRLAPTGAANSVADNLILAAQCRALPHDLIPLHHGLDGVLSVGLVTGHLLVQLLSGAKSEDEDFVNNVCVSSHSDSQDSPDGAL